MELRLNEFTLTDALMEARIAELPEEFVPGEDNGKTWVKAIVLVTKNNCSQNYAVAVNDGEGNPYVVKDFGSVASIVRVDKIYPFVYLAPHDIPDLRNKREIVAFLSQIGHPESETMQMLSRTHEDGTDKTKEEIDNDRAEVKRRIMRYSIVMKVGKENIYEYGRTAYEDRGTTSAD